ncbi:plant UBX domain-containing protein 7 [Tripterygium wilfordii]|uniref:Plant UBX domain-containing protein 7 n=1 Tax=Tripterygium wilfordii TaxID=458696 RepID=A0A7J7CG28_TRIWF|nr:plant UBX domain-containing protein 7-like [Tripterygium wilfordii]KAF5732957.1 plant UBX domain-containing protein 7 [Tripterygium wilfordii]
MEGVLCRNDEQALVSSFLEIAIGQTPETAKQFLQATEWRPEEAINLFFSANQSNGNQITASKNVVNDPNQGQLEGWEDDQSVRPPLPVVRQTLYDDSMSNTSSSGDALGGGSVWESDNLASLFRPPSDLMFQGSFEKAKEFASMEDKWLLVNLQSMTEFSSHMLNRDVWANETVSQTIKANFIFWQVYDDAIEGKKVRTYYRLDSAPIVLFIDPITGQKIHCLSGMVQPETLLENLQPLMEGGPRSTHIIKSNSVKVSNDETTLDSNNADEGSTNRPADPSLTEEPTNSPVYPPLSEEPKGDRNRICRVGVRLPDGRRVQRNFLCSDPIQFLWSFCNTQLGEAKTRHFQLKPAMPIGAKRLDYGSKLSFRESGIANSLVMVVIDEA